MSESAEPATDSVEVEEENIQPPKVEELTEEPQVSKVTEEKQESEENTVPEPEENREPWVEEQQLPVEQILEKSEEDPPETVLEESQGAMQLPVVNMSGGAIEDEEMPSMVSISSTSKIDDSESYIKQDEEKRFADVEESGPKSNSKKEEDNDSDSVCVIDDDDEEEEEGSSFDDDSSFREDDDSEEMDRKQFRDQYDDRHVRDIRRVDDNDDREEDYDDDDENDEEITHKARQHYDDDEDDEVDIDDDSEPDGCDGESDNDVVFRHSNGLTKLHKERSASLQDLSLMKGQSLINRHNVNPFNQKARFERNQVEDRRGSGKQYAHVQSKVKKYIMEMTEQRRMSSERRKMVQEEAKHRSQELAEMQIRNNEEVAMTCKSIKNYTAKGLKEVSAYEEYSEEMYMQMYRSSMANGEPEIREEDEEEEMDVDQIEEVQKGDKINGTVTNENQNNYIPERKGILRREDHSSKPTLNGEDPLNPMCDLRTLSYEEYMKGSVSKEINDEVINDDHDVVEMQSLPQKPNSNDNESASILRIENITSNFEESKIEDRIHDCKTPTMMVNRSTETHYQENPEIVSLKSQLEQRNAQFDNLRDAYQKTVTENLSMKMELENMKRLITYYQEQQKPTPETKPISVQTDATEVGLSMPVIGMINSEQANDPKLATTSMISAISSQWSDSTGSAAISMEPPPNVTNTLNSDESVNQQEKTPKTKNAFSRAFITSTRILQTLSNITHGKSKVDKSADKHSRSRKRESVSTPLNESTTTVNSENIQISEPGPSNLKKRKATDTMEISSSVKPFKIPYIIKSDWHKDRADNVTPEPQVINDNDNNLKADEPENEAENEDQNLELDDNVKVFIYPEDEQGREHSFLIQAKEVTDNPKPGVRECGPYLLGNVEVYMTEMNGTINIWGKELGQGSTSQNVEELETSTRSRDVRAGFRWQSTPRIFNTQTSASTSKKSRVIPRFTQEQKKGHFCEANKTALNYDSCESHNHRVSWPSCHENIHEGQNTCCASTLRVEEPHRGCIHKEERRNNAMASCCSSQKFLDVRRYSLPNVYQENNTSCCYNVQRNLCKSQDHQRFLHRHSYNSTDDDGDLFDDEESPHSSSKFCRNSRANSPHTCGNSKLVGQNACNSKSSAGSCSDPSLCQNDSDPLISQRQPSGVPEPRKRKLSGRKVRGLLLELLKGCGDCRTTNPINKTSVLDASMYEPSPCTNPRPACSTNQPSCSFRVNEKCSSCRTRNDKTAEIEAQLEYFQIEMDKLRSRSDTLREMLDTLRTSDKN